MIKTENPRNFGKSPKNPKKFVAELCSADEGVPLRRTGVGFTNFFDDNGVSADPPPL